MTSSGVASGFHMAEAFGVVLEGARTCRNLTLEEVARRAGLNSTYVERLECGVREPQLSQFIDLAAAVGVSPVWLLEETIAWRVSNDPALEAEWAQSRNIRMCAIGVALASAVLACSDRELALPAVVGERIVEQLAGQGLMVVAIPTKQIKPPAP